MSDLKPSKKQGTSDGYMVKKPLNLKKDLGEYMDKHKDDDISAKKKK